MNLKMKAAALVMAISTMLSVFPTPVLSVAGYEQNSGAELTSDETDGNHPEFERQLLTEGDYQYVILADDSAEIRGYIPKDDPGKQKTASALVIPDELDGRSVTSIGKNAFMDVEHIQAILVPSTVRVIHQNAFSYCKDLNVIAFLGEKLEFESPVTAGDFLLEKFLVLQDSCQVTNDDLFDERVDQNISEEFQILCLETEKDLTEEYDKCLKVLEIKNLEPVKKEIADRFTDIESRLVEPVKQSSEDDESVSIDEEIDTEESTVQNETEETFSYTVLNGTYCQIIKYNGSESSVTIPAEMNGYIVQSLGDNCFKDNESLEEVVFPDSLETMGSNVFSGCSSLTRVSVNAGLTNIGARAFQNCTSLETITLSGSIAEVGASAFEGDTALSSIGLPSGLKTIRKAAFKKCTALTGIQLSSGLNRLESYAFENCSGLEKIDLPDGITEIAARAFYNCSKLSEVGYPKNWKTVLDREYNSSTILSEGSSYYGSPFEGCSSLKRIEIDEGTVSISKYAFRYLTALESVVLPESVTAIGVYSFDGCTSLRDIQFSANLTTIPNYAFQACKSLGELVLPSSIESLGNYSFNNCSGLRILTMDENLKTIGDYAFAGCTGMLSLVLNDGLETLAKNAFYGCSNLQGVQIPQSVTLMETDVFDGCPKLTVYCYSGSAAHMASEAEGYRIFLLDEHEHQFETVVETSPTCERGGSQILTCSICGYYYVEVLAPLGHDYQITVIEPGCTEEGYTIHHCSRCGKEYMDEYVPAHGHEYGEWSTTREPTCEKTGSQIRICSICQHEDVRTVKALGHSYVDEIIEPSCTVSGGTRHTCSRCQKEYVDHYTDPVGHAFGEWTIEKEATVLEEGTRSRNCSRCGYQETEKTEKIAIDPSQKPSYGEVHFTIVDAETLDPIDGASLFISTEKDGEATLIADAQGKITQVLPVGQWQISVLAKGYKVRNINITVSPGTQDVPLIGLSTREAVDASLTTKEMTYDEIIEAGIDVDSLDNKQVYKYETKLWFHEELDPFIFVSYLDGNGNTITSHSNADRVRFALNHFGETITKEPVRIVKSDEFGQFIHGSETLDKALWKADADEEASFENDGYQFEGYGLPSSLKITRSPVFPENKWKLENRQLSMQIGDRKHYLAYRDEEFSTVSGHNDSTDTLLFKKVPAGDYPTESDYVYALAGSIEAGEEYLVVEDTETHLQRGYALSHQKDLGTLQPVEIYSDDHLGNYILDEPKLDNSIWLSSEALNGGLKIVNNQYFAQCGDGLLEYNPFSNEDGWVYTNGNLIITIEDKVYYLARGSSQYYLTTNSAYAASVRLFEKDSAKDDLPKNGPKEVKTVYKETGEYQKDKEYVIIGVSGSPRGAGSSSGWYYFDGGGGEGIGIFADSHHAYYLIFYGTVTWLKEMYDVEMLIMNNSQTDTLENCVAELNLPEGVSLATMVDGEQSLAQTVDHIPEGGSHSVHWYIRGDQEGDYNITASLSGVKMPFNEEFYYQYEAESALHVYAGSALHMTFYIPEAAYKSQDYTVKIELENVSPKVIYGLTHAITGWEQGKMTWYSDGRVIKEVYGQGGFVGSKSVDAFFPGDKLVIELDFEILFESEIIDHMMETVNKAEVLHKEIKFAKTILDIGKSMTGFISSASGALDKVISAGKVTDALKLEATGQLLGAVDKLYGKIQKGDSETLKIVNDIKSSDVMKSLESLGNLEECEAYLMGANTITILNLTDKIMSSITKAEKENEKKKFDAFDSMRTLVSNLPIRYVLDSVAITTREGSTTVIPHTVTITPVKSPYMGVDSWGKYIYSTAIASMGKMSSPWYLQVFGAPDDITGYDDAVAYIQQTEQQIAAYSVHKGSGTRFKAWIERNPRTRSASETFQIEMDNETAEWVDGKLTFTGNALLEVTALTGEDGVLCVEDDEGNVKRTVISVVEPHECHGSHWTVELAPTADYPGYQALLCDVCGDVLEVAELQYCEKHDFTDWIVELEPTEDTMGIQYRECKICHARETEYLPITKQLYNVQLYQYGEEISVVVDDQSLSDQQIIGMSAGSEFFVDSEQPFLMAWSTDGGTTLTCLEGQPAGSETRWRYVLPDTLDQDLTLYATYKGDVNGDGSVDLFDVFGMRDHLLGEELSGIFYEAGCLTDDHEIDMFDIYSLAHYIETGTLT